MVAPLASAIVLLGAALAGASQHPALLVTVGEVTDSGAVIWVRGGAGPPLTVSYEAGADRGRIEVDLTEEGDFTGKALLRGLAPGARYRYEVRQGVLAVRGEFLTAPSPNAARPVRFAWSGDLGSRTHCRRIGADYPIFRPLAESRPDFFLFVGDTIYADHACEGSDWVPGSEFIARTLAEFRAKHRYNRADGGVQEFFRSVSVYAIWDDHEVKNDFSGSIEPLMPIGRQAFLDYFPIVPPAEEPGRLYRSVRWGRVLEVFILDTRQYRSPNRQRDGPAKTMLGPAQRRWLIDGVVASTATWKVVVTSVPLSIPTGGQGGRDSWSNANLLGFPEENATGFALERDAILRAFGERRVKNLVFLAADVHHAELFRHEPTPGWSFHEFVAGPLAAATGRPRPPDAGLNPRSLFALGGVENFGLVDVDASSLVVTIVDVTGQVRGTHRVAAEP